MVNTHCVFTFARLVVEPGGRREQNPSDYSMHADAFSCCKARDRSSGYVPIKITNTGLGSSFSVPENSSDYSMHADAFSCCKTRDRSSGYVPIKITNTGLGFSFSVPGPE